jgi:hypothetical protein
MVAVHHPLKMRSILGARDIASDFVTAVCDCSLSTRCAIATSARDGRIDIRFGLQFPLPVPSTCGHLSLCESLTALKDRIEGDPAFRRLWKRVIMLSDKAPPIAGALCTLYRDLATAEVVVDAFLFH